MEKRWNILSLLSLSCTESFSGFWGNSKWNPKSLALFQRSLQSNFELSPLGMLSSSSAHFPLPLDNQVAAFKYLNPRNLPHYFTFSITPVTPCLLTSLYLFFRACTTLHSRGPDNVLRIYLLILTLMPVSHRAASLDCPMLLWRLAHGRHLVLHICWTSEWMNSP